jgi:hypothetical protein
VCTRQCGGGTVSALGAEITARMSSGSGAVGGWVAAHGERLRGVRTTTMRSQKLKLQRKSGSAK